MKKLGWSLYLATALIGSGVAQTIDLYTAPSYDGTSLHATGVMQYGVLPGCTMCSIAYHTYADTITITSASGRHASCNFNTNAAASQAQNLRCETSLAANADVGDWSVEAQPSVYCSMMGYLIDPHTVILILMHFGFTTTYYGDCSGSWYNCTCHWLACSSGVPTCWNTGVALNLGGCSGFMKATYPVFYVGGLPHGTPICGPPVGTTATGPGPCN